jgi:hypothetical protein
VRFAAARCVRYLCSRSSLPLVVVFDFDARFAAAIRVFTISEVARRRILLRCALRCRSLCSLSLNSLFAAARCRV